MIRLASEADIPQIIALTDAVADLHGEARPDILKAHPRHISEEKLLKNLRSEAHLVIVSELDGVIAGAMLCTLRRLEGDIKFQDALVLSIEDTSVEKRYRKSGIGSALLQFAISEGVRRGCARIEASVWGFNSESQAFFSANGFRPQRYVLERHI